MESARSKRVLVVANRTAAAPRLLEAVRRRADEGPCEFTLLIPDVTDRKAADWTLETALRLMRRPARGKVVGRLGRPDMLEPVRYALREPASGGPFVAAQPRRVPIWSPYH